MKKIAFAFCIMSLIAFGHILLAIASLLASVARFFADASESISKVVSNLMKKI